MDTTGYATNNYQVLAYEVLAYERLVVIVVYPPLIVLCLVYRLSEVRALNTGIPVLVCIYLVYNCCT